MSHPVFSNILYKSTDFGFFMRSGWRLLGNKSLRKRVLRQLKPLPWPSKLGLAIILPSLWLVLHLALLLIMLFMVLLPLFWLGDL